MELPESGDIMVLFGRRLKELRKENKMTQKELGDAINVTKVSICCYEKGTRVPSLETLIDISNLFKVDLDYLIGNDTYVVSDKNKTYGIKMSNEEIRLIKELRKHIDIYLKLIDNPQRMLELIDKKIR